jgi:ferric-dicitrate binding protein FerR (iron transport regulator)
MNRLALVLAYAAGVLVGTLTALWLIYWREPEPAAAPLPDDWPATSWGWSLDGDTQDRIRRELALEDGLEVRLDTTPMIRRQEDRR